MAVIGELAVNIVARTAGLRKGVDKATRSVQTFGQRLEKNITKVGAWHGAIASAAGIGGLGLFINRQLQQIDALGKMSDRLGIATEALAGLQHAAQLSGVSTRTLEMGLQRMTRRVSEAAQGTGESVKALQELGLRASRLAQMAPEQQFATIADALNRVRSQTDRVRLAFKLFDSEGVALLQLTKNGSAGLASMADEADRLGKSLSGIQVDRVEALNDSITRLKGSFSGLGQQATTNLAPPIQALSDSATDMMQNINLLGQAVGRGLQKGRSSVQGRNPLTDALGFDTRSFSRAFMETLRGPARARAQANIARFTEERLARQRPGQELLDRARSLGDSLGKLTKRSTGLIREFEAFPAKAKLAQTADKFAAFGRFFGNLERQERDRRNPVDDLRRQFGAFETFLGLRYGLGMRFRRQRPGIPSPNAALEAGTREAFIAARSGQRRSAMEEMRKDFKKEVKLSEVGNDILRSIRDNLQGAAQVVGIPLS